ncbi:uncharacterized protein V6R79_012357 [Siganus canaliculatus]
MLSPATTSVGDFMRPDMFYSSDIGPVISSNATPSAAAECDVEESENNPVFQRHFECVRPSVQPPSVNPCTLFTRHSDVGGVEHFV